MLDVPVHPILWAAELCMPAVWAALVALVAWAAHVALVARVLGGALELGIGCTLGPDHWRRWALSCDADALVVLPPPRARG